MKTRKRRNRTTPPSQSFPDLPPVTSPGRPRTASKPGKSVKTRSTTPTMLASFQQLTRRIWKTIRITAALLLVAFLVTAGLFYLQVRDVAQSIVVREVRSNPPLSTPLIGGINILLIGVDERPDHPEEGVRSDTLILARLNPGGGWVNLLAIPRDTQVDIPGLGTTKINVAYGHGYDNAATLYGHGTTPEQGGMALAATTVEQFLGLPQRGMRVDYTAQINFDGFTGIIDTLGGITIEVPYFIEDYEYPTADLGTTYVAFQPGPQHMDGATALIYARTRHYDSDFSRSQRQQQVLHAIVSELRTKDTVQRIRLIPGLLSSIAGTADTPPPVVTTLPIDRFDVLTGLVILASNLQPDNIGQLRISPDEVTLISEIGSNLVWDPDSIHTQVTRFLQKPQQHPTPATPATTSNPGE